MNTSTQTTKPGLIRPDYEGDLSRNLLAPLAHPDAWVFITGPWRGLVYNPCSGQRATREPLVPAAPVWAPGGQR